MSTEKSVREAVVAVIESKWSELGFDSSPGNVKEYLLDNEAPEKRVPYLMTDACGERVARAWAVQVTRTEENGTDLSTRSSEYSIDIVGYYAWKSGAIINTMLDHALVIKGELAKRENAKLSGTVDFITDVSSTDFSDVGLERIDDVVQVLFTVTAFQQRAAY